MADLPREDLLVQLRHLADRRQRSVDEMMEELLAPYQQELSPPSADNDDPPPGTLAALAKSAERANIRDSGKVTARNSREILKSEYADYLKQKRNRAQDEHSD